ncbi:unnamed protein product [Pedinophyceae sp. YPF-701]|nr:unnamed protein product [Pedinophyceae sp. YPF-701]
MAVSHEAQAQAPPHGHERPRGYAPEVVMIEVPREGPVLPPALRRGPAGAVTLTREPDATATYGHGGTWEMQKNRAVLRLQEERDAAAKEAAELRVQVRCARVSHA